MKTLKYLFVAIIMGLFAFPMTGAAARVLPADIPTILVPHNPSVDYRERTLCYIVPANIDYNISCDENWVSVRKNDNGSVYIHLAQNYYGEPRKANVTFANDALGVRQVMTVTQSRDQSVEDVPTDFKIIPSSGTDNTHQGGDDITKTYDGNYNTMYHSAWSGFDVSRNKPAILTYNFKAVEEMNYIIYNPRQGGGNGAFGEIEVFLKHSGENNFTSYGEFDFRQSSSASVIKLSDDVCRNVTAVQFKVYSGVNNFASCAEMEFFAYNREAAAGYDIFGDAIYSTLREGVTQDEIDAIDNPFVRALGTQLLEGSYKKEYRVGQYECFTHYQTLSDEWNAPGKYYDQQNGVTGINISKGKHAIVVSGIPEDDNNIEVGLRVIAWYTGHSGDEGDTGGPETYNFALRNGLNVIDYNGDWDGLAYVRFYAFQNADKYADINVHFINGQVNGYLSPEKTNKEMHEICANAVNKCMDVYGRKVHSIWTAQGLHDYCKAANGTSLGYRQYINVLDSLIQWEHRSLGFEKYGRVPKNRTMAYVNWSYYMFQGGYGVSFKFDQERRVLNCKTLMYNDNDAIWGLSHEWGHQHQMHPYFCWAGLSEVSNNVQSYYNITHMGYRTSDKIQSWPDARKHFYETTDKPVVANAADDEGHARRRVAYDFRSEIRNTELRAIAASQTKADTLATAYADNSRKAISLYEMNVGEMLCPFIMLNNYFTNHRPDGRTDTKYCDFSADWYESLRQNDGPLGSDIEKHGFVDKYELIASAQNGNKNNKFDELKAKYPESCWVAKRYIDKDSYWQENSVPFIMNWIRKTSRLTGYNLWPYFERFGFLRCIALRIGDYGNKWYVMSDAMYDEFKADMDQLVADGELKEMPEQLIKDIFYCPDDWQPVPTIAND